MSNQLKVLLAALITAAIALLSYLGSTLTSVPAPQPSASPSSLPSPDTHIVVTQMLDTFERPEWAPESKWVTSVTRTILKGQVTGFVGRSSDPCTLVGSPGVQQIVTIQTQYPSAKGYRVGTYYDAIQPLTTANCASSPYFYFEGGVGAYAPGNTRITIVEKARAAPTAPTIPFMLGFNNGYAIKGWCGSYCGAEAKGIQVASLLAAHRMQPYATEVTAYDVRPTDSLSFSKSILPYALSATYMPIVGATDATFAQEMADIAAHPEWPMPWIYVKDEPQEADMPALRTVLAKLKGKGMKRMVTTPPRADLDADIFAPVAEQLKPGAQWAYVSCMSNGCGPDRYFQADPKTISHTDYAPTGAPDLVIDAPAANEFGMFIMAMKHKLAAVLYYNSNEGWKLWAKGVDVWADPYNFGGNGDGTLLYPDRAGQTAYPSIRLKLLREASNWADIVSAAGMQADAAALMTTALDWQRDMGRIEALRDAALSKL